MLYNIQMDLQAPREQKRGGGKTRVRVAIRVRPFIEKQKQERSCIQFRSDSELLIGGDRSYKFDRVFREDSAQSSVYEQCIRQLVLNCFDGYNAAVLAYGQTGSGKTFTMGTAASNFSDLSVIGIIPRTIYQIFKQIEERREKTSVEVRASFIEIYNEQIIDLLSEHLKDPKQQPIVSIRQEKDGSVTLTGVNEETVADADQMFRLLQNGSKNRTTASTLMNDASSRSHAIFTITIKQSIMIGKGKQQQEGTITAKFFFVDLAGSERAKKTGATGAVLKEGININLGLLELGNVISALSTIEKNRQQFITFRNSKLTRILQDCLGGNSNTYMIACISPAESNYQESLSTLKYASKAMNIKNTPIVNRDEKTQLRQKIMQLEEENRRLRGMLAQKGVRLQDLQPVSFAHNSQETKKMKEQLKQLTRKLGDISQQLQRKSHKLNELQIKSHEIIREKQVLKITLQQIIKQNPHIAQSQANIALKQRLQQSDKDLPVLQKYMAQVQTLQQKLSDKDSLFRELQNQYNKLMDYSRREDIILKRKSTQLQQILRQNQKLRDELKRLSQMKQIPIDENLTIPEVQQQAIIEDEAVKSDTIIQQGQKQLIIRQQQVRQEILQMDKTIEQRQKFLEKMSQQNMKLGTEIISSLNQGYHQKIVTLQREKKKLIKQKDEVSLPQKLKLTSKIDNLQNELKDYRKKDKQQRKKEKLMENQSIQIKQLVQEIKKFKVQKITLQRKFKEDKTQFDRLKTKRLKQLMVAKKENQKKDNIIRKLTIDNYKNIQYNKKKDEEIRKVKRLNEALKTIAKPVKRHHNRNSLTQSTNLDQIPESDDMMFEQEQIEVVQRIKRQILIEIDRQSALMRYQRSLTESNEQLDLLYADDSGLRIQFQRLQLQQQQRLLTEQQLATKQELAIRIENLKERIITCSDSLKYNQANYSNILATKFDPFDLQSQILFNPLYNNITGLRSFLKSLFFSLKNLLYDNTKLVSRNNDLQMQSKNQRQEIITLRQQIISLNSEYCRNLSQAREQLLLNKFYNEQQEAPPATGGRRIQQRDKRELQKKVQDLSKANRQLASELQKNRRKCEVVQQKYQSIKNLVSKDKNIGTQELPNFTKIQRRPVNQKQNNRALMDQLDGMLDNIDRLKKVKSYTALEDPDRDRDRQEKSFEVQTNNKWQCTAKIDAHNSSVLSLAAHQSLLVTSATKNIRVWDLENGKIISDLTGPQINGSVKFITIDPIRRLLFSSCERTVTIWDLVTLEVQGTLKCHKDEVRAIHVHGDYIFTGGKGTANGGSLLVWDLRKLNPNQALQEKQKNQDIFTFTSNQNILYYGTRNHSIRRMNTNNFDILSPFEPPHLDSVTGLAVSRGKLVSGSKDKHLRLWALDHSINNSKHTLHVFNDYVNTLHCPTGHSLIYAGSKDGQVKVCFTKNEKIQILSGIMTHTQSVNALTTLSDNPYGLVTASQDKTVKLWQPSRQTLQNIARENYF